MNKLLLKMSRKQRKRFAKLLKSARPPLIVQALRYDLRHLPKNATGLECAKAIGLEV